MIADAMTDQDQACLSRQGPAEYQIRKQTSPDKPQTRGILLYDGHLATLGTRELASYPA